MVGRRANGVVRWGILLPTAALRTLSVTSVGRRVILPVVAAEYRSHSRHRQGGLMWWKLTLKIDHNLMNCNQMTLSSIYSGSAPSPYRVVLHIEGKPVEMEVDIGAAVTICHTQHGHAMDMLCTS